MKSFDIYGDWTEDTDAWVHCTKCMHLLTWAEWGTGECRCGADLSGDATASILSGKQVRERRETVDRELREWTELNKPKKPIAEQILAAGTDHP